MDEELSPEAEIIDAHITATTIAFQVLVRCLHESGALERGEFQNALRLHIERSKMPSDLVADLLNNLRQALLD